jgi:hypothetical protein
MRYYITISALSYFTAVQNKLKGAFKIGIRTKVGHRLKAEVSFKELFFFSLKPPA